MGARGRPGVSYGKSLILHGLWVFRRRCRRLPASSLQLERLTQVHLTHLGVGKDFFRTSLSDHGALIDDVRPAADPQGLAHVVVRNQHADAAAGELADDALEDRKSTRLNSSHPSISYAVFCLKKK